MSDLMSLLYEYAQSNCITKFIDRRAYGEAERLQRKCLTKLEKSLSPQQMDILDRYLDAFLEQQDMDQEATFLAGFSLARELGI